MEDRFNTFLVLCRLLNYRRTAEELNLSQPAVTKQIQGIERDYGVKLFSYESRKLSLTKEGMIVENHAKALAFNDQDLRVKLRKPAGRMLRIGATKSIGDFLLAPYLESWISEASHQLSLTVDNTQRLLQMLDDAMIDFAFVEGFFNKGRYAYRVLVQEPFTGICSLDHPFRGKEVDVSQLKGQTLLVREKGSGTRDMLEHALNAMGEDLDVFSRIITSSSLHVIKSLARKNLGISFVYETVAKSDSTLSTFNVKGMSSSHDFSAVWIDGTGSRKDLDDFLKI